MTKQNDEGAKFVKLVSIIRKLREPGGCPWDQAQDEKSLRKYFLEEAYEVLDALHQEDSRALKEELGDMLMEIVFLARVFEEKKKFSIGDALDSINEKMVKRHPHVFGDKRLERADEVSEEWAKIKRQDVKAKKESSLLDYLPRVAPALHLAYEMGRRVSQVGFDWPSPEDVLDKIEEEYQELKKAMKARDKEKMEEEIGDLLFSIANLARHLEINPELALQRTNDKFKKRFNWVEKRLHELGRKWEDTNLQELDSLWEKAKKIIK